MQRVIPRRRIPGLNHRTDIIRLFSLSDFEIHRDGFFDLINSEVGELEWDLYDVRRRQIQLLHDLLPEQANRDAELLRSYYAGSSPFSALEHLLNLLTDDARQLFDSFEPYRRRSVAKFEICTEADNSEWFIRRTPVKRIAQNVQPEDIRSMPRSFREMSAPITESDEFSRLLSGVADMVRTASQAVRQLECICWHTGIITRESHVASNSPEGIHQDGADFIVSALVLDRQNIRGGESRIFGPDQKTICYHHTLDIGDGLFQADANSNLWHDVTPISVYDPEQGYGERRTLGFDLRIIK